MLLLCSVVFAACGTPVAATGRAPTLTSSPDAPAADVLRVVCDEGITRVETPLVRAFADGVHAHFENPGGAAEYWIRAVTTPDDGNHGGPIPDGDENWGWSDSPGDYYIGCYEKGDYPPYYEVDERYARYEVVDVDGLWISPTPECEHQEKVEGERLLGAASIDDVESWVRDRFNVEGGERVRPGYPQTRWKGDPWVIRHDGKTLASFHAMEQDGTWVVNRAEGCASA